MDMPGTGPSAIFMLWINLMWERFPLLIGIILLCFGIWGIFISDERTRMERIKDAASPALGAGMVIVFLFCLEAGCTNMVHISEKYAVKDKTMRAEIETMVEEDPDYLNAKAELKDRKEIQVNGKQTVISTYVEELKDEEGYDHYFFIVKKVTKEPGEEDMVEYSITKPCGNNQSRRCV